MKKLLTQSTSEVEILNFQTFTTEYVAMHYGVSTANVRIHKKLHADEIVENIHFVTKTNKFGTNETKWTLRGIIKLGMFIRSPQAKAFRLWTEQELEKSINVELEKARLTQEQNLMLENELTNLERRNKAVALGYKSQLAQQKEKYELKLKVLECELEHKNNISYDNPSPELRKALAERGYLLMDKNMFNLLSVNLGASLCKGISRILGSSYPKCLMQLTDVGIIELKNYFHKNININQGLPFMLEECKIRQVDNCYAPIYNKWIIEDGEQIKGWELELRYKH